MPWNNAQQIRKRFSFVCNASKGGFSSDSTCCVAVFVASRIFLNYEKIKFALLIRIILPSMLHSMVVLWKFVSSDDIILERRIRCAISCIVGVSAPYSIC